MRLRIFCDVDQFIHLRPAGYARGGCGSMWITSARMPGRCPKCGAASVSLSGRLKVAKGSSKHNCADQCQTSDSLRCSCACGGELHGSRLE